MRNHFASSALLAFALLGCGAESKPPAPPATVAPPLPAATEAKRLIEESAEFGDFQFTYASWSIPLRHAAQNEATLQTVAELRRGGWLSVDGSGDVLLTPKARADHRFLLRENQTLDVVPLARKELLEVVSITRSSGGDATALFRWRWVPNEVGALFTSGLIAQQYAGEHRASASLLHDGSKWQVGSCSIEK